MSFKYQLCYHNNSNSFAIVICIVNCLHVLGKDKRFNSGLWQGVLIGVQRDSVVTAAGVEKTLMFINYKIRANPPINYFTCVIQTLQIIA